MLKKKKIPVLIAVLLLLTTVFPFAAQATEQTEALPFDVDAASAVLMDCATGDVLYSKNGDAALPPASVTKIMTLLLIMEAIDSGNLAMTDEVQASDYASGMGGSQVFLKAGEIMTVEDMLKCVVIASANDAAVALAERVAGSESAFVAMMNARAVELGMKSTHFENVTGLDDDTVNHVTSALDIAIMSRELMKHKTVFNFTTVWMDTVRDGTFGLTNTNRLIRFYNGATGLKTGSTAKAKFCISATAERDGMHLIAVIMGSPTRDIRNAAAKTLLDWGFANFEIYSDGGGTVDGIGVTAGQADAVRGEYAPFAKRLAKGKGKNVTFEEIINGNLTAPIKKGERLGERIYSLDGEEIGRVDIVAEDGVERIGFFTLFVRMLDKLLLK